MLDLTNIDETLEPWVTESEIQVTHERVCYPFIDWKLYLNGYFGKQWRPWWNDAPCDIASGSDKINLQRKKQTYFGKFNCDPLIYTSAPDDFDNHQYVYWSKWNLICTSYFHFVHVLIFYISLAKIFMKAYRPWAGYRPPSPPPPRGNFVHYDFLKLHYIRHKIKNVSPLRVAGLTCNITLYKLPPEIALTVLDNVSTMTCSHIFACWHRFMNFL